METLVLAKHSDKNTISNKYIVLAFFVVFCAPVFVASWLLSSASYTNHFKNRAQGQWLKKPLFITNPNHKWLILGLQDQLTKNQVQMLYNVRLLLGKNRDHVEFEWVLSDELVKQFSLPLMNPIFLVDPKGMLLMSYQHEQIGKPLLDDIKHLIKHNPQ